LRENWTAAGMLCIGHQRRGIGNIGVGLPSAVVGGLPAGAVWIKPYRIDPMGFYLFNRSQLFGLYKFSIDLYDSFMPFLFALRYTRRRVKASLPVEIVSPRID